MVNIKPKQPSSNTIQKRAIIANKNEDIITKRIMEYDEYEEVEGTEYLVVQGENVAKRISVDTLLNYDNDISKIIVDRVEYEPNEEGIIDISDIIEGLATAEHEHDDYALVDHEHIQYALVDHKHDEYLTEHQDLSKYATKDDLKFKASIDHKHTEYAPVEHYHDEYLTEHQDLSHLATKDMIAASDARCESLIESHEHEEYALKEHEHEQYLTEHQDISHLATKDMVRALDARYESLINNHEHDEYLTEHQSLDHLVTKEEFSNHINELNAKIKELQDIIEAMPKLSFNEDLNLVVKIGDTVRLFKGLRPEEEVVIVENEMVIDDNIAEYVEEEKELTIENAVLDEETGNLIF